MKQKLPPSPHQLHDYDIVALLVEAIPEREVAAGSSCNAAQSVLGARLTPREIIDTARSLGADPTTVLALLGFVQAPASRPNRRAFYDLLKTRWSYDRPNGEAALAIGLARMTIRELGVTQ